MKSATRPHLTYLSALRQVAGQSRQSLHSLVSHRGELGRITEEIIKVTLERLLPKRFSIGTGIIINSAGTASAQTDIVVYDEFFNRPLLSEYGVQVFPVECVYATIEVKSVLNSSGLRKCIDDIMLIRSIGSKKRYVVETVPEVIKTPPRSYIVAFRQTGLGRNYAQFRSKLSALLDERDAHVHGVCILESEWFALRQAYKWPAALSGKEGNALAQLYRAVMLGQENYSVYPMDIKSYLDESE